MRVWKTDVRVHISNRKVRADGTVFYRAVIRSKANGVFLEDYECKDKRQLKRWMREHWYRVR